MSWKGGIREDGKEAGSEELEARENVEDVGEAGATKEARERGAWGKGK